MSQDLRGKVALVTGAASGLGLLVCRDLAREGTRVAGIDMRGELLATAIQKLCDESAAETLALPPDLSNEVQVVEAVRQTFKRFGRIDLRVKNAGIRQIAPVSKTDTAMRDRIRRANLNGQFLCTREVLKQSMLERRELELEAVPGLAAVRPSPARQDRVGGFIGKVYDARYRTHTNTMMLPGPQYADCWRTIRNGTCTSSSSRRSFASPRCRLRVVKTGTTR